ncbi:carbon storage regulator [Sedimentibacter sp. zth1]|uniref:carbon storage regulator n=1 Tax=Sedimentibacter sp. zth1 TaxID=2816908 RepID=UPI001A92A9F4|nr:carbon storage regulator [Sedimentibacter sp. zth1]QSX06029.1 carbon storage regulator [Sedimentibacter sp. zth1]
MLVIKRKLNESILIGDNIEVIVSEISGDKIKLAISAPNDIKIMRKELKETLDFNKNATKVIGKSDISKLNEKLNK